MNSDPDAQPGPSNHHSSPTSATASTSELHTAAAGGNGGGGGGDSDDSDDDDDDNGGNPNNNNNNNNNDRRRRNRTNYFGNNRYRGMRRTHAAFYYDPANFVDVADIGDLEKFCPHCGALTFPNERNGICCNNGKVSVALPSTPELLLQLMNGSHPQSAHFLKHIQQFNGLFKFTSFGADIQFMSDNNGNRRWTPNFKVLGQVYHRYGALFPANGQEAKFMQVYFLSESDQFARRRSIFDGLNSHLIQLLTSMMETDNPYVAQFKAAVATIRQSHIPNLKVILTISIHFCK